MLKQQFQKIGARVQIEASRPSRRIRVPVTIDIRRDRYGEFFLLRHDASKILDVSVLSIEPKGRHLLLLSRGGGEKQKFLCGHDERHWFVAAIPETEPVCNVAQAKKALKPAAVREREVHIGVRRKQRDRRRNRAFIRQGEWFFVPKPELKVTPFMIMRNEPLVRSRLGKPHFAEECFRTGGELVYVSRQHPEGLTEAEYRELLRENPAAKGLVWRTMRRNPEVYVRGRISHPDHKTVVLHGWHRVYMNTETLARANAAVVFLD